MMMMMMMMMILMMIVGKTNRNKLDRVADEDDHRKKRDKNSEKYLHISFAEL